MTASLWIPGPLPGMNEIVDAAKGFGGRGVGYTVMKRQWTGLIKNLATRKKLPAFPRAWFQFDWVANDRRHNPDNIAAAKKFVLDGLVKARVLGNDGWDEIAGWRDTFATGSKPGVLVTLSEEMPS